MIKIFVLDVNQSNQRILDTFKIPKMNKSTSYLSQSPMLLIIFCFSSLF